jgi:hypothetical protein
MRSLALVAVAVAAAGGGPPSPDETCDAPSPVLLGGGGDGDITMAVSDDGVYWVNPCGSVVFHATSPEAGATIALQDPPLG